MGSKREPPLLAVAAAASAVLFHLGTGLARSRR
ncbi:hypothetical protein J2S66_002028 [Saccharothrix longispora]|uniref:MYXO-CTERM domain-containing protein n=1 Tax=Saccharothrix longispora TaxID=33920 RepID=A0ABU1PSP7_9PSEU|nr:hypothetical protein [Saccharothrix longispora]